MQTFLPYPDFHESAKVLDLKRLGKQRVENLQIMNTLSLPMTDENGKSTPWANHPAVKMWRGYEAMFLEYQRAMCEQWVSNVGASGRNYSDSCFPQTYNLFHKKFPGRKLVEPFWLGDAKLHISHQSNLIRKKPEFYGPIFPDVPDDIPYFWPVD